MRRLILIAFASFIVSGCVAQKAMLKSTSQRTRTGACARAWKYGSSISHRVCLRAGHVDTVSDDPNEPMVVWTTSGPSLDLAKQDGYILKLTHNGEVLIDSRGDDDIPEPYVGSESTTWSSIGVVLFGQGNGNGWAPGTYEVEVIPTYDTTKIATATITLTADDTEWASRTSPKAWPSPGPNGEVVCDGARSSDRLEWATAGSCESYTEMTVSDPEFAAGMAERRRAEMEAK